MPNTVIFIDKARRVFVAGDPVEISADAKLLREIYGNCKFTVVGSSAEMLIIERDGRHRFRARPEYFEPLVSYPAEMFPLTGATIEITGNPGGIIPDQLADHWQISK